MISATQALPRETQPNFEMDLAREVIYRFFAALLREPQQPSSWSGEMLLDFKLVRQAAQILRAEVEGQHVPLGAGELPPETLNVEPLVTACQQPLDTLTAEYVRIFGLVTCRECPPYETEYCPNDDTFYRTQHMADVAGFYRAFGLQLKPDVHERSDYLPLELEFAAHLLMKKRLALAGGTPHGAERARICDEARLAFVRDHLAWWLPSFAMGLRRRAQHGLYYEVGCALASFLPMERRALEIAPPALPIPRAAVEDSADQCAGCSLAAGQS